jgi:hypothetical protein
MDNLEIIEKIENKKAFALAKAHKNYYQKI